MALKDALLLACAAALIAFSAPAAANDVPVRFCVVDCISKGSGPKVGVKVQLGGCVDEPVICTTGNDGCCTIDPQVYGGRKSINYCNGNAGNFCNWNVIDGSGPYIAQPQAFMRGGEQITPKEFSCCWCNGQDYCNPVIYSDAGSKGCTELKKAGTTDPSSGPFTVTFTDYSCSNCPVVAGPPVPVPVMVPV